MYELKRFKNLNVAQRWLQAHLNDSAPLDYGSVHVDDKYMFMWYSGPMFR